MPRMSTSATIPGPFVLALGGANMDIVASAPALHAAESNPGRIGCTPGGVARDSWEAERARRINKPGTIQVTVENLQVSTDGDRATAKFRQHYKSGALKTSASKTLALVRRDGKWLIQQERVGN